MNPVVPDITINTCYIRFNYFVTFWAYIHGLHDYLLNYLGFLILVTFKKLLISYFTKSLSVLIAITGDPSLRCRKVLPCFVQMHFELFFLSIGLDLDWTGSGL